MTWIDKYEEQKRVETMLKSKQLKKHWRMAKKFSGSTDSFRMFLRREAQHADVDVKYRDRGETYPDAAHLLLLRKRGMR
jgi:hypothetical protein